MSSSENIPAQPLRVSIELLANLIFLSGGWKLTVMSNIDTWTGRLNVLEELRHHPKMRE